ncbi:hypothetical protein EMPG_17409 [Blastomyces silverae]|uniref:Uncharacterized protein n=1 Tax=Blastomyces silverae TaxID=2060906 RepID=A0A0H1B6N7_9EURO|nr:hypothetical protein EMPG_17409 [Blastomyces silverae]
MLKRTSKVAVYHILISSSKILTRYSALMMLPMRHLRARSSSTLVLRPCLRFCSQMSLARRCRFGRQIY